MLELFLLSALGTVALASMTGLIDWFDSSPSEDIEEADLDQDLALLDESAINDLETAFLEDPILAQGEVENEDDLLQIYTDTDWSNNQGTPENDFIAIPDDITGGSDPIFAGAGDDVLLGSDGDNWDVFFGDEGDDTIFGRGGYDQIFGEEGNDILSGGDGDDLIVGGDGSDVIYGGAGNDNIYDSRYDRSYADDNRADVIVAGDGDDGIVIEDGVNLISLGEGADHVMVYTESGDNPNAVITDFDPAEDMLLLGVYDADAVLPDGASSVDMAYTLTEIDTELGPGTLVQPAALSEEEAASLEGASVGHAVLLGVTPDQLSDANIHVVLQNAESNSFADDSIYKIAEAEGATRL